MSPPKTPGHLQASLGQSLGVTAPFSWVLAHTKFCLCPPRVCFPVLCKFWWLYGGVNGDLFQEGLCHTQVCCTQSTCPSGSPLLTLTSTATFVDEKWDLRWQGLWSFGVGYSRNSSHGSLWVFSGLQTSSFSWPIWLLLPLLFIWSTG